MLQKNYFPDFMIIGAQKSGTTTLHFLLNQHPNLTGSNPKELHYFDKLPKDRNSLEWYKSHFSTSIFKKRCLFFESTPNYLYHSHIPVELFDLNPLLRFIVMLRNPVTRCFSAWNMYKNAFEQYKKNSSLLISKDSPIFQYFFKGRKTFPTLDECLDIEQKLITENQTKEPALLRRGLYYDQLVNYFKSFHPDNFYIVESEDFRSNVISHLDQIVEFLGVPPFNKTKLNVQNQHERYYDHEMSDGTKTLLNEFYNESNEKLYNMLGKRFEW